MAVSGLPASHHWLAACLLAARPVGGAWLGHGGCIIAARRAPHAAAAHITFVTCVTMPPLMCEDCNVVGATFGMRADGRRRWCSTCSKRAHAGAVSLMGKPLCEVCNSVRASYGLPAAGKLCRPFRWCAACSRGFPGAQLMVKRRVCEDCGVKRAVVRAQGAASKTGSRWCQKCANMHPEAGPRPISSNPAKCRDCGVRIAVVGLAGGYKQWCHRCGHAHVGATKTGLADGRRAKGTPTRLPNTHRLLASSGTQLHPSSPRKRKRGQEKATVRQNRFVSTADNIEEDCAICLDPLFEQDIYETQCNHRFHVDCLSSWLRTGSTCPLCNARMIERRLKRSTQGTPIY